MTKSLFVYLLGLFGCWLLSAAAVELAFDLAGDRANKALEGYVVWAAPLPYIFGWAALTLRWHGIPYLFAWAALTLRWHIVLGPSDGNGLPPSQAYIQFARDRPVWAVVLMAIWLIAFLMFAFIPLAVLYNVLLALISIGPAPPAIAQVLAVSVGAAMVGRLLAELHIRSANLRNPTLWRWLHGGSFVFAGLGLQIMLTWPERGVIGGWVIFVLSLLPHALLTWHARRREAGTPAVSWRCATVLVALPYRLAMPMLLKELPVGAALAWPVDRARIVEAFRDSEASRPGRAANAAWGRSDALPLGPDGTAPTRLGDRLVQVRIPPGWRGAVGTGQSGPSDGLALRRLPGVPGELREVRVGYYRAARQPSLLPETAGPTAREFERLACWRLAAGWECWAESAVVTDGVRAETRRLRRQAVPDLLAWGRMLRASGPMMVFAPGLLVTCVTHRFCTAEQRFEGGAMAAFETSAEQARNWPVLRSEVGALVEAATGLRMQEGVLAHQPDGPVLTFDAP